MLIRANYSLNYTGIILPTLFRTPMATGKGEQWKSRGEGEKATDRARSVQVTATVQRNQSSGKSSRKGCRSSANGSVQSLHRYLLYRIDSPCNYKCRMLLYRYIHTLCTTVHIYINYTTAHRIICRYSGYTLLPLFTFDYITTDTLTIRHRMIICIVNFLPLYSNSHTANLSDCNSVIANLAVLPSHIKLGLPRRTTICLNLLVVWSTNICISTVYFVHVNIIIGLESCNSSCSMLSPHVYF